jgi:uncharacterized protein (UPF0264 family)
VAESLQSTAQASTHACSVAGQINQQQATIQTIKRIAQFAIGKRTHACVHGKQVRGF